MDDALLMAVIKSEMRDQVEEVRNRAIKELLEDRGEFTSIGPLVSRLWRDSDLNHSSIEIIIRSLSGDPRVQFIKHEGREYIRAVR